MNKDHEYLANLAFGFLRGTLSTEEKVIAAKLVVDCQTFRDVLRDEIAIKKGMEALKETIPPRVSKQIYLSITVNPRQMVNKKILGLVFDMTLPEILQPLSKLVQRSV